MRHQCRSIPVLLSLAAVLLLASCKMGPDDIANKYNLPSDPFDKVILQVYDLSKAYSPDSEVNLVWNLHLSDPEWANYLSAEIFVGYPGQDSLKEVSDLSTYEDAYGKVVSVSGLSTDTKVTFGDYRYGYSLADPNSSDTIYTETFAAHAPNGSSTGTYYTALSSSTAKFADITDFSLRLCLDGIEITMTSGTLSTADTLLFDLYKSSASSTLITELSLSGTSLATLKANGVVRVQPAGFSTFYTDNGVTSSTNPASWYCDYCTIDDPESAQASRTQFYYVGYDADVLNKTTTNSNVTLVALDALKSAPTARAFLGKGQTRALTAEEGKRHFVAPSWK